MEQPTPRQNLGVGALEHSPLLPTGSSAGGWGGGAGSVAQLGGSEGSGEGRSCFSLKCGDPAGFVFPFAVRLAREKK